MRGSWEAKLRTKGKESSEHYTVTALTPKAFFLNLPLRLGSYKGVYFKKKKKLKIIVQKQYLPEWPDVTHKHQDTPTADALSASMNDLANIDAPWL